MEVLNNGEGSNQKEEEEGAKDNGPSPVEAVTAGVAPTPDEPKKLAFLNGEGAGAVAHTGNGKFDAHLLGVRRVLRAWGAGDDVCDAGLFHSIYGTEGFQGFCIPFERRDDVRALIGERAEQLAYVFCVVDRLSVDNDLDSPPGTHAFTARPELGGFAIPMPDDAFWFDFITLTHADWLEQVEGAAAAANPLFEWRAGEAWGYRRRAYERMAGGLCIERCFASPASRLLHSVPWWFKPSRPPFSFTAISFSVKKSKKLVSTGFISVLPFNVSRRTLQSGGDRGGVDTSREGAPRGGVRPRANGIAAPVASSHATHVRGGARGAGRAAQRDAQIRVTMYAGRESEDVDAVFCSASFVSDVSERKFHAADGRTV